MRYYIPTYECIVHTIRVHTYVYYSKKKNIINKYHRMKPSLSVCCIYICKCLDKKTV